MSHLFANYNRLGVAFESGQGCWLKATDGREFLDFLSGIAVTSLGHAHPRMVKALQAQVSRLLHVSNLYEIPEQEKAATHLSRVCQQERAFFCNSGAEANECLIKLARRYAHEHGLPPVITVTHNSFHGRTLATVSATGNPKYQQGFEPLVPGFQFVDFNDLKAARESLEQCCAILVEPIQGEGGVIPATSDYLGGLKSLCEEQGKLLLLDEVQTGIGRTGSWLAAEHYGVKADATALAKGLGGGVPVGAVLTSEKLSQLMGPGSHGTTFGGNPLASIAISTVLEVIEEEGLLERVRTNGHLLREGLKRLAGVTEVRGVGLMLAVITEDPAAEIAERAYQRGLLVNAVRPHAVRLAPPLIITETEVEKGLEILEACLCPQSSVGAKSASSA